MQDIDTSSDSDSDENFVERVARASVDMSRYAPPTDARKAWEPKPTMPMTPGLRRSIDQARRSMEGGRVQSRQSLDAREQLAIAPPGATGRDSDGESESDGAAPQQPPRKSLEEQFDENDEESLLKSYPMSKGLSSAEAQQLFETFGPNVLPEKVVPKWKVFVTFLFLEPMPIIIWIAAIVEISIQNYPDFAILVAIVVFNASLNFHETVKAGDAVAALKSSLAPECCVKRDGQWVDKFHPRNLVPGDLIRIKLGSAIPADCMVNHGVVEIDNSAMTGETLPEVLHERGMAKMGGTVMKGEVEATVIHTGANTFFGKTAALLEGNQERSNLQKLLLFTMICLCCTAGALALISLIYLLATKHTITLALDFAVVLIVASVPLAMEIVTTTTLALGSRELIQHGAIVARLTAIEDLAGLNMLCSDKTGTLTKNKMEIQDAAPCFEPDLDQMTLLRYAALATQWEAPPGDALDTLFLRCHLWYPEIGEAKRRKHEQEPNITQQNLDQWASDEIGSRLHAALADYERLGHIPFDPTIKRTESTVRHVPTGRVFKVTKGAPHIILQLEDNPEKHAEVEERVTEFGADGVRSVAIAFSEGNGPDNWKVVGLLTFLDPPREDTKDTIHESQRLGVPVRMITGDNILIAKNTCKVLEMGDRSHPEWPTIQGPSNLPRLDENKKAPADLVKTHGEYISQADGFAEVWPEHKYLIVETYRRLGYKCGMTGDGVNDAPALKVADVGIAVSGATAAAQAAADIVLTHEGLSTIIVALRVARIIFRRMKSFLTYRISVSLYIAFTVFIALYAFPPLDFLPDPPPLAARVAEWSDYFQPPVLFLILITVFNDGCIIAIGYDRAVASDYPERWILPALWSVSLIMALWATFTSLIWIYCALDSWNSYSLFQKWHIGGLEYGEIMCGTFMQISITAFLTLVSARTQSEWFFSAAPHPLLAAAAMCALSGTTLLSLFWPYAQLGDIYVTGLYYIEPKLLPLVIWIYSFVMFVLQDAIKVFCFTVIRYFNLWDFNGTAAVEDAVEMQHMKH